MSEETYGEFRLRPCILGGSAVIGKLGKMRKDQDFIVRPASDGSIYIQSDKSTGKFDFRTRKGVLNTKGTTFAHLNAFMGAVEFEFPPDFVRACLAACPSLDGETDTGRGVIVSHTVKVI